MEAPRSNSDRIDLVISNLLRAGVLASLLLLIAGLAIAFLRDESFAPTNAALERLVRPGTPHMHTLREAIFSALKGDAQGLLITGALMLIATPILRVVVSLALFAREKDRAFVIITACVLALLIVGVMIGGVD